MGSGIEIVLLLLLLTDFVLLGARRIALAIRVIAVQGFALGCLPLLAVSEHPPLQAALLAALALGVKGIVFPWLLFRALRDANIRHEVEPYVSPALSLALGVAGLVVLIVLSARLDLPRPEVSRLAAPAAFFTSLAGLFLIVTRKKAITQVLGYLVLENGVYAFGVLLSSGQPWIIELGVLLDVFVAVFIMGIIIFHIRQTFDHVDVHRLTVLHDWERNARPPREPRRSGADRERGA